jgi:predicted HTH domain antitoxin
MKTSVRPLQGWEVEQIFKLHQRQPGLIEPLLGRLVREDDDVYWSLVVGAYQDRQINLGKAAELLELPEIELRERFVELGVPLRIGPVDLPEAHAEVEAVRAWFAESEE